MPENDLLEENKRLKEKIIYLESLLEKSKPKLSTAYEKIRAMISEKVETEVHQRFGRVTRQPMKRQIMDDLKWELRVRYANDLKDEHIEPAKEFIQNYQIEEYYKKESC